MRRDLRRRARDTTLPGERGKSKEDKVPLHYKGSKLHRIVNDSHCQGGDIRNGDGTWSGCTLRGDRGSRLARAQL